MAITDLIERIEGDASSEAAAIMEAARAEAAQITARAEATAAAERQAALAVAAQAASDERETLLANARLSARDGLLARKREQAEAVLVRAQEALESMPEAEYLELVASAVERAATGDEVLTIASADATRLSGLAAALKQRGLALTVTGEPAPIDRGVLLTGDRVRVEISPASLVADARDQLLLVASQALFGGKA